MKTVYRVNFSTTTHTIHHISHLLLTPNSRIITFSCNKVKDYGLSSGFSFQPMFLCILSTATTLEQLLAQHFSTWTLMHRQAGSFMLLGSQSMGLLTPVVCVATNGLHTCQRLCCHCRLFSESGRGGSACLPNMH